MIKSSQRVRVQFFTPNGQLNQDEPVLLPKAFEHTKIFVAVGSKEIRFDSDASGLGKDSMKVERY